MNIEKSKMLCKIFQYQGLTKRCLNNFINVKTWEMLMTIEILFEPLVKPKKSIDISCDYYNENGHITWIGSIWKLNNPNNKLKENKSILLNKMYAQQCKETKN